MYRLVFVLCALFFSPSIFAQATHPCAQIAKPKARLECYDKAFPPPLEVHEAVKQQAVADFGMQLPHGEDQAKITRLESTVVSSDWVAPSIQSITLANGQVWRQTQANSTPIRNGESVVVSKGAMGNYLLTTQAGVRLRVKRTR